MTYLAHDLKTPLTSVIGYLSLLDEVPDMPEAQRVRYTGVALDKACRLERLVNEFFDITRYSLTNIELELAPVDLAGLLVQLADEFYPALAAHGNVAQVTVAGTARTVEQPGEPLMVTADAARLARVFGNLLRNAIAYSDEGTPIELAAVGGGARRRHRLRHGRDHPPRISSARSSTASSGWTNPEGALQAAQVSALPSLARSWSCTAAPSPPRARTAAPPSPSSCPYDEKDSPFHHCHTEKAQRFRHCPSTRSRSQVRALRSALLGVAHYDLAALGHARQHDEVARGGEVARANAADDGLPREAPRARRPRWRAAPPRRARAPQRPLT